MQGIYNYIPETNCVSCVYSVAAVLYLQFVLNVMLCRSEISFVLYNSMKTKINQQNAQINSGLIYYWSITPTCFGPSVEAIIREFEILESYKAIVLIC